MTATYRLHLFDANPSASMLNDNVAKAMDNDDRGKYLGFITFSAAADEGEFSRAQTLDIQLGVVPAVNTLYGILEDTSGETAETVGMTITIKLFYTRAP